ncbi:hypothetical protein [Lacticaseibacillus daqingensis]|uniref:hypothetical protein n=1 Tax=Lacticaseibacillus daqingensis TaxID=2486014 RepID=UPI000F7A3BBF|nr:hypothetical protein [Lacticaseibacillus daqingensis]
MAQEVNIGSQVDVKKSANVPLSFTGTIEKLYANAALLSIDSFDAADAEIVEDLKHKTVINYKNMKQNGKAVEPPKPDDAK